LQTLAAGQTPRGLPGAGRLARSEFAQQRDPTQPQLLGLAEHVAQFDIFLVLRAADPAPFGFVQFQRPDHAQGACTLESSIVFVK
jgi:hypothetical protein